MTLRWKPVRDATYYDLVVWREGKRVLDLWPVRASASVRIDSHRHSSAARLGPGRYLWFVYPGFGAKSSHRYGAPTQRGTLVVAVDKGGK